MDLDLYDSKILSCLDRNSRESASSIAKKIKIAKETVNYRINRMAKKGPIKTFYTLINPALFDGMYFSIFIEFRKFSTRLEKDIIVFLRREMKCHNLHIMEGKYQLMFQTVHRDIQEFQNFIHQFTTRFGAFIISKEVQIVTKTYKLDQKWIFSQGEEYKIIMNHLVKTKYQLDDLDRKIIEILAGDARKKITEIANEIREDAKVIAYRIKSMQKKEIIAGFSINLDLKKIEKDLIQINIAFKDQLQILPVIEFFSKTQCANLVYETVGRYDLSLQIYVDDDNALRRIMQKFKQEFIDFYIDYDIHHIYKEYTMNWIPTRDENHKD